MYCFSRQYLVYQSKVLQWRNKIGAVRFSRSAFRFRKNCIGKLIRLTVKKWTYVFRMHAAENLQWQIGERQNFPLYLNSIPRWLHRRTVFTSEKRPKRENRRLLTGAFFIRGFGLFDDFRLRHGFYIFLQMLYRLFNFYTQKKQRNTSFKRPRKRTKSVSELRRKNEIGTKRESVAEFFPQGLENLCESFPKPCSVFPVLKRCGETGGKSHLHHLRLRPLVNY